MARKRICPDCKGVVGTQLVDIGGLFMDAKCVTCDGTGYIIDDDDENADVPGFVDDSSNKN